MIGTLAAVSLLASPAPRSLTAPPGDLPRAAEHAFLPVTAADAPLGVGSCFLAAASSTTTGLALMLGGGVQLSQSRTVPGYSQLVLGALLFNFGPSIADLLTGNATRFVTHGSLRLGLLVASSLLIVLGPLGALLIFGGYCACLAWIVADTVDSTRAPDRWAASVNEQHGFAVPKAYRLFDF